MIVRCTMCHIEYDDIDHDTMCPHKYFRMHTIIGGLVRSGAANDSEPSVYEEYVVVSLDDLHAVQEHFAGRDIPSFAHIAAQKHVHTSDMHCLSPDTSGRLVEGASPSDIGD